jgi:CheY-like chemotaxis protein
MAGDILVVDGEPEIRGMIGFSLSRAGFAYSRAGDEVAAGAEIIPEQPDLIVLDWMLPGQSGIDFARRPRRDEATRLIPIIMVTARRDEDDRVRGLDLGADDDVTKPFAPRELVARIEAVLRRTRPDVTDAPVEVGGLVLDRKATELSLEEQQKLCIARLLPVKPRVLLMDEPCSALDPKGTEAVEELIWGLSGNYTIVIVTHNMAQARRASNECIFMLLGKVVEHAETAEMFVTPAKKETADYIEGRYG